MLDYHSVGLPQCWTTTVLGYHSVGLPQRWATTVLDYHSVGLPQCWTTTVLDYHSAGLPQCWTTTVLDYHSVSHSFIRLDNIRNIVTVHVRKNTPVKRSYFIYKLVLSMNENINEKNVRKKLKYCDSKEGGGGVPGPWPAG